MKSMFDADQSLLTGDNIAFLEDLYHISKTEGSPLGEEWQKFFSQLQTAGSSTESIPKGQPAATPSLLKEMGIQNVLNVYRNYGYHAACLDPLNLLPQVRHNIDQKIKQILQTDLELEYDSGISWLGKVKVKDLLALFESIYCTSIGYEYYYLVNDEERLWLQNHIESEEFRQEFTKSTKLRLFDKIVRANQFEKFLAKKYIGKKRFSLEGGDSFIALLDRLVVVASQHSVEGIVMGMAHRGRLNVLVNVMQKPADLIFAEFEENYTPNTVDYADVKYHLGYSNYIDVGGKRKIKFSLMFNPSHLEAINPVVMGSVRARQTMENDSKRNCYIGVLVHGDASFPGQGVVAETLNLSGLDGFTIGGCIHIVINNQIGFTTLPKDSRSTLYATDLAQGFQYPIFHVNADDPEAVIRTVSLAMAYRMRFKKDVIIDLICYRRLGHNETDEPSFTQPLLYDAIKKHPIVADIYERQLLEDGAIKKAEIDAIKAEATKDLEIHFNKVHQEDIKMFAETMNERWSQYSRDRVYEPNTQLLTIQIARVIRAITNPSKEHSLHPKIMQLISNRKKMCHNKLPIDWGCAESLSLGSLLLSGVRIRLVGQDVIRGTFSHRHAGMMDTKTNEMVVLLNHISKKQAKLELINSALSEFSVLGYEYGYSLADPRSLVIWEAQFGDFVNGAQVVIDQFLTSSEKKWLRMSGLVVLLPHGYEGQGPEHSSARMERLLQLCAEDNIRICYPTLPSQIFHLLRRQSLDTVKKPLFVLTPKSLLRLSQATSNLQDLIGGSFRPLLFNENVDRQKVKQLIVLTGKLYYDLAQAIQASEHLEKTTVLCRVEQLYPFPKEELTAYIQTLPALKKVIWLQEEPINTGAWSFVRDYLIDCVSTDIHVDHIGRPESASVAVGMLKLHVIEQKNLFEQLFQCLVD